MPSVLHEVTTPFRKATFGMGCFWAGDALFGAQPGVLRTRVGYSGGTTMDPVYKKILDIVSDENLPDSDDSINDPNYDSDTESLSSKDASSPGRSIKKSRKRTRNPQNWNTNRQKQKVASGMEHKSKNKVIPAKTIAMPCTDSFQCTTNFNEDLRKSINSAFWNPDTDINHKRQFVASHVKKYC
nr:unnamed protein product [Callosobruchus analis]